MTGTKHIGALYFVWSVPTAFHDQLIALSDLICKALISCYRYLIDKLLIYLDYIYVYLSIII